MQRKPIEPVQLSALPVGLWEPGWFLLTCGDFQSGQYNTMTVSWGSLGVIWGRPFAQVVVRPQRHTYQFIEKYSTFTLCAFPEEFRPALNLLGTKSGRDGNKIAEAGLTPIASGAVPAPAFAEAELILCCQKRYWHDLDPDNFLDDNIARNYPARDYHRSYFGQILAAFGIEKYQSH